MRSDFVRWILIVVVMPVGARDLAARQPADAADLLGATEQAAVAFASSAEASPFSAPEFLVRARVNARYDEDLAAMQIFRPSYPFWKHVFAIPDGSVAFGSGRDGRLLAVFPTRGDWTKAGQWFDESLASVLSGVRLQSSVTVRRQQVADLLEPLVGRVVHNATRGEFLMPNVRRYGSFLKEWGAIYERFGVPAEIGLAQAIVESGLSGTIRSEAKALGFCQWLPANWERLKRLAHTVIEGYNQTTQAAYCAAYLTVLATKYGSFIPALSEHHTGGANVGRTVINGARLGGANTREQYLMGSEFAIDLRNISTRTYSDVVRTYGPRSFLYSEMVFGNTINVREFMESIPQERIYAMRVPRATSLSVIAQRTGLSVDEIQRFNPALKRQVPAGANLYLPMYVEEFGPDVSFWHRPASPEYMSVLLDFVSLDATLEDWEDPAFDNVLRSFQRRFQETGTEEGAIMATVLAYTMHDLNMSRPLLAEYRASQRILSLFERGVREREATISRSSTSVAR